MRILSNPEETAQTLGVRKSTLYRLYESGQLPGYKIGRAVRFDIG